MTHQYDNLIILIPAHLNSQRFPRKAIADIRGKPKIQRIYEHVTAANLAPVYIATGDQELANIVSAFTQNVVLTDSNVFNGTDCIKAGLDLIDPTGQRYQYVMNFQGDAINTDPKVISELMDLSSQTGADITTPALILDPSQVNDPAIVKITLGLRPNETSGRALYFSRNCVPHDRDNIIGPYYHHVGLYLYKAEALNRYVQCEPGILEQREKLEQLRALENGMTIYVKLLEKLKLYENAPPDIDTPEDLEKILSLDAWD